MPTQTDGTAGKRQVHVFLDTTEFISTNRPNLLGDSPKRLIDAARSIDARVYVTDLVLEELCNVQLREMKESRAGLSRFREHISVPTLPSDDAMRETLLASAKAWAEALGIIVIPAQYDVNDATVLLLREARRVEDTQDLGFADAVQFLSMLRFASLNSLLDCWFISRDKRFDEEMLASIAAARGISLRLYLGVDRAVQDIQALSKAGLRSLEVDIAKEALRFVTANKLRVLERLRADSAFNDRVGRVLLERAQEFAVTRAYLQSSGFRTSIDDVEIDAAIPVESPREDVENRLMFHGRAILVMRGEPSVTSPRFGTFYWGRVVRDQSPLQAVQRVEVPIVGEGRGRFRAGKFEGEMSVDKATVAGES